MPTPTAVRRGLGHTLSAIDRLRPTRSGIVVLAYHRVGATTPVSVDLPVAQFADQLDWLVASADTVTLDAAADYLITPTAGRPARPMAVLTADDGTADWVDRMLPLLVARQLPMTWYVATEFIENQRSFPHDGLPISWGGLAEAVSTGLVTVASHSHTHAVMAALRADEAAAELDRSIALIEDRLGEACTHFAYPKAMSPSVDAERAVRQRFRTAALAGNRINVTGSTDLARLGRTPVQRDDNPSTFAQKVCGLGRTEGWVREFVDRRRHRHAVT